jgi:pimeloyl-ACP methyl ester carboxylesterase
MEMREPFDRLAENFHVYAPDLLGYGLSDRPDIDYTPELYIELIEDILREVVQRPSAVLASSLSSAHAIEAAANNPEWITSLVLVCPTGLRRLTEQSAGGKVAQVLLKAPILGQALFNAIASRPSIRYFLEKQTYHDPELVTEELVDRYYRTAHTPGARYAPAAFVSGKLYWDASDAWTRLEQNALIVWGSDAGFTPPSDAAPFLATNPRAELEEISAAGVLPHDEQPDQFARLVATWLAREQ